MPLPLSIKQIVTEKGYETLVQLPM